MATQGAEEVEKEAREEEEMEEVRKEAREEEEMEEMEEG
jgi:hypothetical protein